MLNPSGLRPNPSGLGPNPSGARLNPSGLEKNARLEMPYIFLNPTVGNHFEAQPSVMAQKQTLRPVNTQGM